MRLKLNAIYIHFTSHTFRSGDPFLDSFNTGSSRVFARAETRDEPLRTSTWVEGYTSSGPVSHIRSAILTLMLQSLKVMQ